ncbi:MAG: EAL domain-containing protein [Thiohalocapsa sp.]|uniref:EAL domain-containing protein n=1 Tax=Thiohalocapsa sp. TaxID=2497641 RepID=UPI0025FFFD4C|nr:EAL domain-containing protein [Thiohalocapsa sp.]MCG6939980.1 EAL domain-containing protein [Thiohalocapsa sp.]
MSPDPAGSELAVDAPDGDGAVEHRRLRGWLLAVCALVLGIGALLIIEGVRTVHLEHALAAERAGHGVAMAMARALDGEGARLRRLLASQRPALDALPGTPASEQWRAAAATLLRRSLPDLIDLAATTQTPAEGPATRLLAGSAAPLLGHRLSLAGTALELRLPCEGVCRPEIPAGTTVRLSHGGDSWLLPVPVGEAWRQARAGATTEAAAARPAAAATPLPRGAVRMPILQPGAADWAITVHSPVGLAVPPLILATLLTVLLTAAGGLRLWHGSRRRERDLVREQQRLCANQRKLEAILDSATDGIVMLDGGDRIELMNPAAEVMFGRLEADVIGARVSALLPDIAVVESSLAPAGRAPQGVYDTQALRGGVDAFPARIAERRLLLDDGPRRLLLVQDLTEQQRQAEQMAFLEQRDVITGLLNRSEFERRMARLLAEAVGSETPYALCYIDIDQFKVINDTVGHAAGDALIGQLAKIIEVKLEAAVLVGRLGGDEFGALFAERNESEVLAICEDLMQTVRNFLFTWRERSYDVAISIGVTAFLPEHESPEAELAKADVACHMAKREGRDRVHVYHDSDVSLVRHHGEMHLVSAISQALSTGHFRLYAQPIIPLTGAVTLAEARPRRTHYEILVRMLDEAGQLVAPDTFIPAAERYILMPAVDRWVIHQLFSTQQERLRQWHEEHPKHFLFAVNISGTSISDESFLPYLKRQFEIHDIPPASICFEVTETAAMRSIAQAKSFIGALAELGCSFALDDFGSGLSSYAYLRELPVQYLKIDGSFVRDMHNDPVNYALVASINQVAHVLGLKTIAEWAESEYVINQLRALNVDFVQGFAIGTPLPVVECDTDLTAGVSGLATSVTSHA